MRPIFPDNVSVRVRCRGHRHAHRGLRRSSLGDVEPRKSRPIVHRCFRAAPAPAGSAGLRGVRELPRLSGDPTRHRHSHTPTRPGHTRRRTALRLRYYMPCGGRIGSFAPRVIGGSSPSALSFIAAVSKMVAFWWPIYSAGAAHALIISRRPLVTRLLTIKVTLRGVIVRSEPYH